MGSTDQNNQGTEHVALTSKNATSNIETRKSVKGMDGMADYKGHLTEHETIIHDGAYVGTCRNHRLGGLKQASSESNVNRDCSTHKLRERFGSLCTDPGPLLFSQSYDRGFLLHVRIRVT